MAFKSIPVPVLTTDTEIVVCPATQEGAAVLMISNVTGSASSYTVKQYKQSTATTLTIAATVPIAAYTTVKFPVPISLEAGDKILMAAPSNSIIVAGGTFTYSAATPAAVGFTGMGDWSGLTTYQINDVVSFTDGNSYLSRVADNLDNQPDENPNEWMVLAEKGAPGADGAGDLTAANNLSDLASKKTGYDNLSVHGADVASASTVDLDAATGNLVDVTGTTTITAITLAEGRERTVRFAGALTLTHGSSLVLPGAANIVTAAGDYAVFRGYAAGVVRCVHYQRGAGRPLNSGVTDVLAVGFTSSDPDQGTKSSGTFTPTFAAGGFQHYSNGGAHTLAPPTGAGSIVIDVTNEGSAGAITTSGFTKVTGDSLTTTNGHKFRLFITVGTAGSHLHKQAMQ
jgi:hypothetical protein